MTDVAVAPEVVEGVVIPDAPTWLVCTTDTYYPTVTEYESEALARADYEDQRRYARIDSPVYLARVVEASP